MVVSPRMLEIICGCRALDVVSTIRAITAAVSLASSVSGVIRGDCMIVVHEIGIVVGRGGVIRGVGRGCATQIEARNGGRILRVIIISGMTKVLPDNRSGREKVVGCPIVPGVVMASPGEPIQKEGGWS